MLSKSKVKYIQSLGHKKQRDLDGVFIAEGPKIVEEILAAGVASVAQIYGEANWLAKHATAVNNENKTPIDADELARISQLHTPNSVLAIVRKPAPKTITTNNKITLALDTIQDPGNLGTIIRIADWFGIDQIVCSQDCADAFNSKVVQASMGSILRVQILYTSLAEWLQQQEGVAIFGAALNGKNINTLDPVREGIIVIGNESKGISAPVGQHISSSITIPGSGRAESLNAAVATGIILARLIKN